MNIASALIRQVLVLQDFETWSAVREHYLPTEYHSLFKIIDKHCEKFHKMPTLEELKYEIRDSNTKDKLYALESLDISVEPYVLLQYLKNEYTQKEILQSLDRYVDASVAFEDAEESVTHLHEIIMDVEDKVELELPQESMQRINLFESDEELSKYLPLGLNAEYDKEIMFSPRDLILVGGRRGAGKSITCANIMNNVFERGKTAIYYTIEMDQRSVLQRVCAISTGIPFSRIRNKNLSVREWESVAAWWANRFLEGQKKLKEYREHRDFNRFHHSLVSSCALLPTQQLDVVYDPTLTLSKLQADLDKKIKSKMEVGVIIVDYLNQVKRSAHPRRGGQYDWTEQIEVSKGLKSFAQEYETTVFSPYQTDAQGEARFAKGILDAADAAYTIETWDQKDCCITFKNVKMRSAAMKGFSSYMNWDTLKIGPDTALTPEEREALASKTGEEIHDL